MNAYVPDSNGLKISHPARKPFPCATQAGTGERQTEQCTCRECNSKGRSAIRCVFDSDGRWLIHWKEGNGDEWVGTYRLIPC